LSGMTNVRTAQFLLNELLREISPSQFFLAADRNDRDFALVVPDPGTADPTAAGKRGSGPAGEAPDAGAVFADDLRVGPGG
ncbi:MAG: hypothetical protein N2439_13625, partial [Anaerolineae bacterium]|nr:hypothetical protein [Anaerolineae bacterium]